MYSIVTVGEDYNSPPILQTRNTKTGGTKTRKAQRVRGWGRNLAFPQVRATDSLCSTLQRAVTSLGETRFLGTIPQRFSDLFSTPSPYSSGGGGGMSQSLHRLSVTSPRYMHSVKSRVHPCFLVNKGMCGSIFPLRELAWVDGAELKTKT